MTPVLDDELRRVLRQWAAEVPVGPERPEETMTRRVPSLLDAAEGRGHTRRWMAAAAAAVLALGAVATMISSTGPTARWGGVEPPPPPTAPGYSVPWVLTTVPPGEVPMLDWVAPVVFRPDEPGWRLVAYYPSKERPFTSFTYRNDDGRKFDLTVREAGCCLGKHRDRLATDTLVRGHNGEAVDDNGSVFFMWEEGGRTWWINQYPDPNRKNDDGVMSLASLLLIANNFEVVSQAENAAWLPQPLVEVLRQYPGVGEITWNGDDNYYLGGRQYPLDLEPQELPVR
jgi:hypothetical protein